MSKVDKLLEELTEEQYDNLMDIAEKAAEEIDKEFEDNYTGCPSDIMELATEEIYYNLTPELKEIFSKYSLSEEDYFELLRF